jgi:hypothetical protein
MANYRKVSDEIYDQQIMKEEKSNWSGFIMKHNN